MDNLDFVLYNLLVRVKFMKVLLIQPPIEDFYQTSIRSQPIGLAYLAASLRAQGHDAEILDCQTGRRRSVSVPPELSYLRAFYPFDDRSPFKLYTGFYHFGMDWEELRKRLERSRADVFGISSYFTPYSGEALKVARMIKEGGKERIVMMGGAHVSCDPESILRSGYVDYVVLGEGELRVPLILGQIERGVRDGFEGVDGIGYRSNGEIRIRPLQSFILDLDALPYPARDLLDPDRYQLAGKRSTMIITSRGCPHVCAYCSGHLVMGGAFRARAPEFVVAEMAECRRRFKIESFDIEDDNFTFDRARAGQLLRSIIREFGEKGLSLTAMNGISWASLDGELLQLMKRAGFETVNISFVSTDPSTRARMKRPVGLHDFDPLLRELERAGLHVVAYAILGMPGQTIQEMVETLTYLMGKRVLIGPSIYYPVPGTPLFEESRNCGILPPHPAQWRSSALPIETEEFDRVDLLTLFRLVRVINFIKAGIDRGGIDEGITLRGLRQVLEEKSGRGDGAVPQEREETSRPSDSASLWQCRDGPVTWVNLLRILFREKAFFGLRRSPGGDFTLFREEGSRAVLNAFLEAGAERPLLGSRQKAAVEAGRSG
jgi:radical SAM superfamily enzyme YgiQ (UPF0313 family)